MEIRVKKIYFNHYIYKIYSIYSLKEAESTVGYLRYYYYYYYFYFFFFKMDIKPQSDLFDDLEKMKYIRGKTHIHVYQCMHI